MPSWWKARLVSMDRVAGRAGVLYFLLLVLGPINEFWVPQTYFVLADPGETATRITQGVQLYRLAIVVGVATLVVFMMTVSSLYRLFAGVDPHLARSMLVLAMMGTVPAMAALVCQFAPLILLSGADYLTVLPVGEREVLAVVFIRLRNGSSLLAAAFWGLWLFPFGRLVSASGFMPRWIGHLLLVGCVGYVLVSVTGVLWPSRLFAVNTVAMPFYAAGELSAIVWLLWKGRRQSEATSR